MSVHSEVYSRLANAAAVTALVPSSKITPHVQSEVMTTIPEQFPAITFGAVTAIPNNTLDGYGMNTRYRFQVDCWVREDYDEAISIATAVRNAIIGSDSVTFTALWVDQREFYEADIKVHNLQLDFSIWHSE